MKSFKDYTNEALGSKAKTEIVHIDKITAGDTIIFDGKEKTLSKKDIGKDDLLGKTIYGDSFKSGKKKVERVLFKKFVKGKDMGWVAQP
jgi:Golgi nucleoside diphosphatase